ncbi:MAG: thermopsin family protease [Candidatus Micrarchaeota archaeon]|nr:thermopsin family protease [Candidatus Micrarchaeota archaeon]
MRFLLALFGIVLLLNIAGAEQILNLGQFLYNNLTVQGGNQIVVGINTSSSVDLMVIHSSDFSKYIFGEKVSPVYNYTVKSGIFVVNVNPGNYTVIVQGAAMVDLGSVTVPTGGGSNMNIAGAYSYKFRLDNYSNVSVSLLSSDDYQSDPIIVNVSGTQTVVNKDRNFYILYFLLNKGDHNLTIYAPGKMNLFVYVNSTSTLVNPLTSISSGTAYSAGIASYGLYNVSGMLHPYQVRTDEVVGDINISRLSVSGMRHALNASPNGASLQLNVGLNTHIGKRSAVYWLQDVVDFNTSSHQYYFVDNIWNNTGSYTSVANSTLVGKGAINVCNTCNFSQTFYAYTYPMSYLNYSMPLHLKLIIKVNSSTGGSSVLWFGYQILQNGSQGPDPLVFFDHVLLPGSGNSTLLTTPFYQTPGGKNSYGNYYDSELVFGGESNGANSYFNQIAANLWMYYDSNGTLVPFPSVYTFGLSTAESASNVQVLTSPNGAFATTGQANYSRDIFASNALATVALYISNTSRYTSQPTTVPPQTTAAQIGINVGNVPQSEITALEYVAGVAIVFILIIGFLLHRRRTQRI